MINRLSHVVKDIPRKLRRVLQKRNADTELIEIISMTNGNSNPSVMNCGRLSCPAERGIAEIGYKRGIDEYERDVDEHEYATPSSLTEIGQNPLESLANFMGIEEELQTAAI